MPSPRIASIPLALGVLACASLSFAQIEYTLAARPNQESVAITVSYKAKKGLNAVEIPNWAPGSYALADNFKSISGLTAKAGANQLAVTNPKPHRWEFVSPSGGPVSVTYNLSVAKYDTALHLAGPSSLIYVADRKTEKCFLNLDMPKDWKAFCGLDAVTGDRRFVAPDYDVLADNPITMGVLEADRYTVQGVPHEIVIHRGPADQVDRAELTRICKWISESHVKFWGGLPFKKYVWHVTAFAARDGGWGLEHLSSTQVGVSTGLGTSLRSVLTHEYFHAWNVKRIRSFVLGPFDYTQLPKTGALWWLEGVTDYYASLFLARYGMTHSDYLGDSVGRNFAAMDRNAAKNEVGPHEASLRVGEANNGRGNSSGYKISYYTLGWLAGFCLDVELRETTNHKVSLDTIIKELYTETNQKPGFAETRIRELLIKHGGAKFGPIYDEWIMKAGKMPIEQQLAKLGWTLATVEEVNHTFGIDANPNEGRTGLVVRQALEPASTVLKEGDVILKIGADSTSGMGPSAAAAALRSAANASNLPEQNRVVTFEIRRGAETLKVDVPTRRNVTKVRKCVEPEKVSPAQRQARARQIFGF